MFPATRRPCSRPSQSTPSHSLCLCSQAALTDSLLTRLSALVSLRSFAVIASGAVAATGPEKAANKMGYTVQDDLPLLMVFPAFDSLSFRFNSRFTVSG